ncbi:hypothetical protein M501DRAFT_1000476 [Patellaria atrata CBS 101060]|uniref:Uncharacterized protein n=1 Tax=Patellaria atrata CBS 101060 TaxID=1346257 RepID=A0A9P4VV58_9PEZI|nr:hypothetical protein M501DRAFT_1000476 [Patellaria atrata CBS 101060]
MNLSARCLRSFVLNSARAIYRARISERSFSVSALSPREAVLPYFEESSSSELNGLLSRVRSKVLIPRHLNAEQERLVYKQANASRLETDPVIITIGDEDVRLEHINRLRDIPSYKKSLKEALDLCSTPQDWENVIELIKGYKKARIKLGPDMVERIVRKFNVAGMQHLMLQLFKQVAKTGFSLQHLNVSQLALQGCRYKAQDSDWNIEKTAKALDYAEEIIELLEHPLHGGGTPVLSKDDSRAQPVTIGAVLEIASLKADRTLNGKDTDGKVKMYTERLVQSIRHHALPDFADLDTKPGQARSPGFHNMQILSHWICVWHGLKLARKVLGPDMPGNTAEVTQYVDDLKVRIDKGVKSLQRHSKKGEDTWLSRRWNTALSDIDASES